MSLTIWASTIPSASTSGAIISRTPMVYKLDKDPMEVIETGDHVRVVGDQGIVVVTKRNPDLQLRPLPEPC